MSGVNAPTGLGAHPTDFGTDFVTVQLQWDAFAGADCVEPDERVTGVNVYRHNGDESPSQMATLASDAQGYNDATVAYDTVYTFTVKAKTDSGEGHGGDDRRGAFPSCS